VIVVWALVDNPRMAVLSWDEVVPNRLSRVLKSTGVLVTDVPVEEVLVATDVVAEVALVLSPEVAEPLLVATAVRLVLPSKALSRPEPNSAFEIDSMSLRTDSISVMTPGLVRLYTSATANASFTPDMKVGVANVGILAMVPYLACRMKIDKK
jgi:hypothetical protein